MNSYDEAVLEASLAAPDPLDGWSGMQKTYAPSESEWQEYQRCIGQVCTELTALKWPRKQAEEG